MCIYTYIYRYIYTHRYVYIYMYTCIHAHLRILRSIYQICLVYTNPGSACTIRMCVNIYIFTHIYCIYISYYIEIYISVCFVNTYPGAAYTIDTYVYKYIHMCVNIYIYTHIYYEHIYYYSNLSVYMLRTHMQELPARYVCV